MDEDTQDGTDEVVSSKKHHDSGSQDGFNPQDESSKLMSPASNQSEGEEEDSDIMSQTLHGMDNEALATSGPMLNARKTVCHPETSTRNNISKANVMTADNDDDDDDDDDDDVEEDEVDPKEVLEQNGIDVSCNDNYRSGNKEERLFNKESEMPNDDLAMEIDSLVPTISAAEGERQGTGGTNESGYQPQPTRLPSFSSIIAGSPKTATGTSTESDNGGKVINVAQPGSSMECITTNGWNVTK